MKISQLLLTFSLHCSLLIANCSFDSPPDPNVPIVIDDTLNITMLSDAIAANPASFDVTGFVKMKGSWESFGGTANGDPLGKLYAAIAPLSRYAGKKIKLDFTLVNGQNIPDSTYSHLSGRSYKEALQAIILPPDMNGIGAYAFYRCTALESIAFSGATPPNIAPTALEGAGAGGVLVLEVPAGCMNAYETAYSTLIPTLAANGATITIQETL